MQLIDEEGYRANVGMIIVNQNQELFWAKRVGQEAWQFPQGGVNPGEAPEDALFRELKEEVGTDKCHFTVLAETEDWLRYRLPRRLIRDTTPRCIGQKQKWFLLQFNGSAEDIQLDQTPKPEFDDWCWVKYWYPLRHVVAFKREVYRQALLEFSMTVLNTQRSQQLTPFQT